MYINIINLFFRRESQCLANSSGDLVELEAATVTALLLTKRPQAFTNIKYNYNNNYLWWVYDTLSRETRNPCSPPNDSCTKLLYFLWPSNSAFTYTLGSCE